MRRIVLSAGTIGLPRTWYSSQAVA